MPRAKGKRFITAKLLQKKLQNKEWFIAVRSKKQEVTKKEPEYGQNPLLVDSRF
jgi:hypothetical protein